MTRKVLIMGLPGSGKTTLATELVKLLELRGKSVTWFNADEIRKKYDDWDFSPEGRIRQAHRMRDLADSVDTDYSLVDFVAPLPEMRDIFSADVTIWLANISAGRFEDTNRAFIPPETYDIQVTFQDAMFWARKIDRFLLLGF